MSFAKALFSAAVLVLALVSTTGALAQRLPPPDPTAPSTSGITLRTPWGISPVLAWYWGASNSGTFIAGGGAGAGKANLQDLSLTRKTDAQSAQLLRALIRGTILTEVRIGSGPVRVTLKDVFVSSLSTGKSDGELFQTENVTFGFREFHYTSDDGTTQTCWDIAESKQPSSCDTKP